MKKEKLPVSVALLSPCGHGNLGDAAIQDAVIHSLRSRIENVRICGITLRPSDTEERHGIPSYLIGAISRPGYLIDLPEEVPGRDDEKIRIKPKPQNGLNTSKRIVNILLNSIIDGVRLVLPRGLPYYIRVETAHVVGAIRLLRDVDLLIISGGGQLDDFWGGPFGHPYSLFKWCLLARFRGKKVVVLSVGTGTIGSGISRFFFRMALHMSAYRSYRDEGSKKLMREVGFRKNDPVYPDLAYSFISEKTSKCRVTYEKVERQIAISPMVYCDPKTWPQKNKELYEIYLKKLAQVAENLICNDYHIILIASDGPDNRAVQELSRLIKVRLGIRKTHRILEPLVKTSLDFIEQASIAKIVIASRMHGVILAHLAGAAVLALSYDRKVAGVMDSMKQTRYCLDIDNFEPEVVLENLLHLENNACSVRIEIADKIKESYNLLSEQYDNILKSFLPNSSVS